MNEHIEKVWMEHGLPRQAFEYLSLPANDSTLSSSFAVGLAAQSSIALSAMAAAEIYALRSGERQSVSVNKAHAEQECTASFTLDGEEPQVWAKYSGLYKCRDGYIRVHANFDHHRDIFLSLLGLPGGEQCERELVEARVLEQSAEDLESKAAEKGGIVSMLRSLNEWDKTEACIAMADVPPVVIEKIGDAEAQPFKPIAPAEQPLSGLRVLELTRVLAGPVCGRTLAAYGADVLLINSPKLPNIEHIADTSRGKRSAFLDLNETGDHKQLQHLITNADVFVQGYRPGGLGAKGFDAHSLASLKPGIVCVDLSAYGHLGPWANKRGFDSILQTGIGFNSAEATAFGSELPRPFPIQILDYATGFLMAFGTQVALRKRALEGGSWRVRTSLLQSANWLRSMGRVDVTDDVESNKIDADLNACLKPYHSNFGSLQAVPHAARFSRSPTEWSRPSSKPGSDVPEWT